MEWNVTRTLTETDLSGGTGITYRRCVLPVQLRRIVILVQRLYGNHNPGHKIGIVCGKKETPRLC